MQIADGSLLASCAQNFPTLFAEFFKSYPIAEIISYRLPHFKNLEKDKSTDDKQAFNTVPGTV